MKMVSDQWKRMPKEEKDKYKNQSKVDRQRFEEQRFAFETCKQDNEEAMGLKRALRERKPKMLPFEESFPQRSAKVRK